MIRKFEYVSFDGFDWDFGNHFKSQKHGISIQEIEALFEKQVLYFRDERHSAQEERWIAVGRGVMRRYFFVVFSYRTVRQKKLIRVISARAMHKKEQVFYEEIEEKIRSEKIR